eukprot:TRINITY_DN110822_c0_g1_i1.p1 TRINITY_DN110822_c0_g1~~TRINITY_DN110822_c0_g1_i1.p1  ORF type:complete len:377 (-),score=65.64 TRINITY_DN110822_c0_g1_i1:492-1622(-)
MQQVDSVPPGSCDHTAPEVLQVAGFRYVSPALHEVRAKLEQFAGSALQDALLKLRIAGASAKWWQLQFERGLVCIDGCSGRDKQGADESKVAAVGPEYVVTPGDVAVLQVHVHDRVVPDVDVPILHDDADVLVVSKPPAVEIFLNPLGSAVHSSLIGMLQGMGYDGLMPVHRIDKPVSGVVCLAKTKKSCSRFMRCVQNRNFKKTYLARVCASGATELEGMRIEQPLSVHSDTATAYVDVMGKPSTTVIVQLIAEFSDGTALLEVEPLSGRMHQIRCHLAHIGCPIANDVKYGAVPQHRRRRIYDEPENLELRAMLKRHYKAGCDACAFFEDVVEGRREPPEIDEGIWLHSWRYEFPSMGLKFEAPMPPWAMKPSS